jgi:hypothetical protein
MKLAGRSHVRPADPKGVHPMPRTPITRQTVDLTAAQADVLENMILPAEERASKDG